MKYKLLFAGLALYTFLIILLIISRREVSYELIRPIPEPTPTCSPTPTRILEYEEVSWYGFEYCEAHNPECITASGQSFDENALTCACNYNYPLGTMFSVSYKDRSVVIRCNDRGNFKKYNRTLDLSKGAFEKLAPKETGIIRVQIEELRPEYKMLDEYREKHGLETLRRNENLEISARLSAEAIFTGEREWSHDGYEASISAYYKNASWFAENLAQNFENFNQVLAGWHDSEGHREVLQHKEICEVGIGSYYNVWVFHGACK